MLLERIHLDRNDYEIYSIKAGKVIVNTTTVNWLEVSDKEADLFDKILDFKDCEVDEIKYKSFIFKLLVNNIIQFQSDEKGKLKETKTRVYFAPNPYCNLECVYCYAEATSPKVKLDFNESETYKIIDNFAIDNVEEVVITGGEPLMRTDIFDIVDYIKYKKKKTISILTNGILINEKNIKHMQKFDKVTLSLDASEAMINDITRGSGTFEKIVHAVRLLKQHKIRVGITSVVSKVNLANVQALLNFIREELGVEEHKTTIHVSHGRGKDSEIECTAMQVQEFRRLYLMDYIRNGLKSNTSLFEPQLVRNVQRQMCGVATAEIFVNEKGEVYPCRLFVEDKYLLGTLLENNLEDIMNNEKTNNFKEKMKVNSIESCNACKSRYLCGGGCRSSHSCYTGSIKESHEPLCDMIRQDIKSSILLQEGINPLTLERIGR
jgi:radical SAM additional 4Fe4S-binding domain